MGYLKLSNFRGKAGPVISRRGKEYWEEGRVKITESDGKNFVAQVQGTKNYTVTAQIDGDDIVKLSCNCPFGRGNICKHEVATLLEIKKRLQGEKAPVTKKAEPDNFINFCYKEISEKQLFLLAYISFAGVGRMTNLSYRTIPIGNGWKSTSTSRGTLLEDLVKKGLVYKEHNKWGDSYYEVYPAYKYFILKRTLQSYPSWIKFIEDTAWVSSSDHYVLQVAQMFLGRRRKFDTSVQDDINTLNILKSSLLQEDTDSIKKIFNSNHILIMLHMLAEDVLNYGYQNTLDSIENVLKAVESKSQDWTITMQHVRLVRYLSDGHLEALAENPVVSSYLYYTEAISSLLKGELDAAIAAYQQGLSLKKGSKIWKIIPNDTINFLAYTLALGLRNSNSDIDLLKKISSYSSKPECESLLSVFPVVDYFALPSPNIGKDELVSFIKGQFPSLFCITELCALLERSKVMEYWEIELQDIIRKASASTGVRSVASEAEGGETGRLAYVLIKYYNELILNEIRQQNKLKNGAWSKGKKLSYVRYQEGDMLMDKIDSQIYDIWQKQAYHFSYYRDFSKLEVLLPYLKDTDKLAMETRNGLVQIHLHEDIPYISTNRKDDMIYFETNLPEKAIRYDNLILDTTLPTEWVYYTINKENRDFIYRITRLKSVPESAETMLEKLFEALKGQVEIHSEIAGATELEKVEAQSRMTLRIIPEGSIYRLSLHYNPLEGGSRICFPGEGEKTIFDSKDGHRYEVHRNLRAEQKSLREINRLLPASLRFTPSIPEHTLDLPELLALLDKKSTNPELFDIEWPEGEPFTLKEADCGQWSVSAQPTGGWFELEGEIELAENKIVSLAQLLEMFRNSPKGFIKLSEDMYLHLSESLRKQLRRIDALAQTSGKKLRVNQLAMAVSGDSLQGDMEIVEPEALMQMRQRIQDSENLEIEIPDSLNATLRDYQEDGVRWILRMANWGAGVCLADDMGLGKTIQTIICMLSRKDKGAQLVVAPASVVGNWHKEVSRFAPMLNPVILNNLQPEERNRVIEQARGSDLLILSYGLLNTMSERLSARDWASICLDEAHTIKNRDTKTSSAAMMLHSEERIILTGTPIQNHLGELWNLFQFINPGLLGSYEHFNERFVGPISSGSREVQSQLKKLISPFILRRTKQEVAKELPDKEEIILPVSLSEEEMAVYEILRREAKSELESSSVINMNTLAMITKLREAACSVSLVEKGMNCGSSKLALMTDKLLQILEQGNRVLVFSQFTSFLDMARDEIEAAGVKDYYYLNGSTALKEREKMVDSFQRGEKRVFLISLKAGGLGLNLTGANYVIHLDPWWNPAVESQATDRAYRIGQKEKVTVYHLISEHTIEEKILRLHQSKRSLADSLLEGTSLSGKLSVKELLEMIAA